RARVETQRDLGDHGQRAPRAGHEPREIEPGDVLDDAAAAPRQDAVTGHELHAQGEVARPAEEGGERPSGRRGERCADGPVATPERIEREPLTVRRRRLANLVERGRGARREREIAGHVLRDAGELPCREHFGGDDRAPCVEPAAVPSDAEGGPARTCIEYALANRFGRRDRGRRHVPSGLRTAGVPCHSRQACTGTTLPGLDRRSGSNTSRTEHIVASESGEKISAMYGILSKPTPCSPEIVPPAAMQARMISPIASCTRAVSSASAPL